MIKKIKWNQLVANVDAQDVFDDLEQEVQKIDTLINSHLESYRTASLRQLLEYVDDCFLHEGEFNVWKDLPIWISSYKENDRRFILLVKNKLREYIAFYNKILTDSGVQRNLVYSKEYGNEGSSSSTDRGTDSVTPQNSNLYDSTHPESDALFDEAIANYASSINKNKTSSTSSSSGSSDTTVTGVTWEEGKKNIQMMFFNELKDYIVTLPERIYSWYSIETIPLPELIKEYLDFKKAIWELNNE